MPIPVYKGPLREGWKFEHEGFTYQVREIKPRTVICTSSGSDFLFRKR